MVSFKFTPLIVLATAFVTRAACLAIDVVSNQLVHDIRGLDDLLPDLQGKIRAVQQFNNVVLKLGEYNSHDGSRATSFNNGFNVVVHVTQKAIDDMEGISESSLGSELFAQLPFREDVDTSRKFVDDVIKQKSIIMGDPFIMSEFGAKLEKMKDLVNTYVHRILFILNSPADKQTALKYFEEVAQGFHRIEQVFL